MLIIRKYGKLNWFDLLDHIKSQLESLPPKDIYIEFMDEFNLRAIESVSEGGTYKIKRPCQELLNQFKERMKNDPLFAEEKDLEEIDSIFISIIS